MPETRESFEERYEHHRDRIIADLRRRAHRLRSRATGPDLLGWPERRQCIHEAEAVESLADDMASLGQ